MTSDSSRGVEVVTTERLEELSGLKIEPSWELVMSLDGRLWHSPSTDEWHSYPSASEAIAKGVI